MSDPNGDFKIIKLNYSACTVQEILLLKVETVLYAQEETKMLTPSVRLSLCILRERQNLLLVFMDSKR